MGEADLPRTYLAQLVAQSFMTVDKFRAKFEEVTGLPLNERQAFRWLAGEVKTLPYPAAQQGLESMFGRTAAELFAPPPLASELEAVQTTMTFDSPRSTHPANGTPQTEGRLISMSADRARNFLASTEGSNVGPQTLEQLYEDVKAVASTYTQAPLSSILGDLVAVQERAFSLLEGRQKPNESRQLYFLAGVTSGLMAKASHDHGASHDAMTHARTAFVCAENADHHGLRAFVGGLQSLISYWAGRPMDAIRYASRTGESDQRNSNTSAIWLAISEARAWATLGNTEKSRQAITAATELRDHAHPDELDEFGGICTFSVPRQLYYAADTLAWNSDKDAAAGERAAVEAIEAYETAPAHERAFSDEAGARTDLAIARISLGDVEGAEDALTPVFQLPPALRIHGIVTSAKRVHRVLTRSIRDGHARAGLQEQLELYSRQPLAALPR